MLALSMKMLINKWVDMNLTGHLLRWTAGFLFDREPV